MRPFPFTLLVSARDEELTPLIQKAIGKFIRELAEQNYPDVPAAHIEGIYRQQHQPLYEALALLITKELKTYAKTKSTNSGGRLAQSGEDILHQ